MALSRSTLHQSNSAQTFGAGGYQTAGFTPTDNAGLIVRVVAIADETGFDGSDLTLTDSRTLTWTPEVATPQLGTGLIGQRFFSTPNVGTGGAMTVTADAGAFTMFQYRVEVYQYTGHDTSNMVGATASGTDADGDGAASITLSGSPATTSEVLAGAVVSAGGIDSANVTHGTGWTEVIDTFIDSWIGIQSQARTGSTSTTVAWDDLSAAAVGADGAVLAAIEVLEAAAGGPSTGPVPLIAQRNRRHTGRYL